MGPQGPAGMNGQDGTDATVTYQAVIDALGYTPGTGSGTGNANIADITAAINAHKADTTGHAIATTAAPGFMSAADKQKLDGIAEGASGDANAAIAAHVSADDPHGPDYVYTPDGKAVNISGTDLNILVRTGFYQGEGLVHAPLDDSGWWYILTQSHDPNWVKQTATAFGAGGNAAGEVYERVRSGGTWANWAKVYKEGDAIGDTAPNSGAFTTLSASGRISASASNFQIKISDGAGEPWYLRQVSDLVAIHRNMLGDIALFSTTGLSINGSLSTTHGAAFGGDVSTANGTLVMRDNSLENHATDASSSIAINYYGYAKGFSQYRDFNIYDGKGELFGHFDGPGHGLVLGIGAYLLAPEDRRLRVVGGHDTATMQLYSFGDGGSNPASLDFWASEPGQTYKGAGIGSNVNRYPHYGTRNAAAYGQYLRFREDGAISLGTAQPGTGFADRTLVNTYGTLMADVAGLHLAGAVMSLDESGVRSWQLRATGGNVQLSSGDTGGAFKAPRLLSDTEVRGQQLVIGNPGTITSINMISTPFFQELAVLLLLGEGAAQVAQSAYDNPYNPSSSAVFAVGHTSASGRSIDATGTINASGADYAEHEYNNGHTVVKGQIIGFDVDGLLTPYFSEAIRFAIKSTEPGYTGGNTWMANLPPRPNKPVKYHPEHKAVGEGEDINMDCDTDAALEQEYQDALLAAEADYQAASLQYERDLSLFNAAVKDAADKVDRIAYCGKVPVNYTGATPGDYLIVKKGDNDSITCYSTRVPTHEQYLLCIGRVNKLLPDGRAEVAVIIH